MGKHSTTMLPLLPDLVVNLSQIRIPDKVYNINRSPKLRGDNDDLEVADGFSISENHFDLFLSLIPSGYRTQKQMSLN